MKCVACENRSSYNRAVVELVNERELGALCPECEAEYFGRGLENGEWTDDVCALCERDGFYVLPQWRAYVVEKNGERISRSEYSLEPPSPRLCDTHFDQITGAESRRNREQQPSVPQES